MLGYLNGIGRVRPSSQTKKTKTRVIKKATPILKKAFALLPPAVAITVAKKVIAKNKRMPNSASQLTQQRALKNQLAQTKAKLFVQKNKSLMLDDENLTETPAVEQTYEDQLMDQEVENEIQQEEEFKEAEEDLGIIYNTGFLSGKAERKAKKEAKVDKKKAKTELKRAKSTAKINRSSRPKKSGKEIFDDVLDSAKKGYKVYSDIKGGKSEDDEIPNAPTTGRTANQTEEGFFAKNKTMILIGGGILAIGAVLLLKGKGKNK